MAARQAFGQARRVDAGGFGHHDSLREYRMRAAHDQLVDHFCGEAAAGRAHVRHPGGDIRPQRCRSFKIGRITARHHGERAGGAGRWPARHRCVGPAGTGLRTQS
jgi:hypothetical protein